MARRKAEPVDIRTAAEQWFVDAHRVVNLCRHLAGYRDHRRHYSVRITDELEQEEHRHRIQTLFESKHAARQVIADQLLADSERLLADIGELNQRQNHETLHRMFTTAYAAIGSDFKFGSYAGGLFAWQVLHPFGYDMARWSRELSVFWKHARDHLDIELEQQYREHCERCPFETGIDYALNKRLTMEHSQITRDLATIHDKQEPVGQAALQKRKHVKPKPLFDAKQRDLVYDFLKLWHRYGQQDGDGNDLFRNGPVAVRELATFAKEQCQDREEQPPSLATISRWFRDQQLFGDHERYAVRCRNNEIEAYFSMREGELLRVRQSRNPAPERTTEDDELDLD